MAILLVFNTMTGQKPISHKKETETKKNIARATISLPMHSHLSCAIQLNKIGLTNLNTGFFTGGKTVRRRAGAGSWGGEGQQPPPHQLKGRERCELPQLGSGWSSDSQRFSTIFSTQDGIFWHYNIIVYCGLSYSHWGQDPRAPPLVNAPVSVCTVQFDWVIHIYCTLLNPTH